MISGPWCKPYLLQTGRSTERLSTTQPAFTISHQVLNEGLLAGKMKTTISQILDRLEKRYGTQQATWPTDPYLFLVWWHCGYPASDKACSKGWDELNRIVGVEPEKILQASPDKLADALRPGGMVPELRAMRLKEIAARVKDEFGGDLRSALVGPIAKVRGIQEVSQHCRSRR